MVRINADLAPHIGVEHEYRVLRDGAPVDFRTLLAAHDFGIRWLDPGDLNACRLPSGSALTCDGREAEIALPPVTCRAGFTSLIERHARCERGRLQSMLGAEFTLDGYSTHVSISIDETRKEAMALTYARTFAPALMLLMDRTSSPGLLVRPRPRRMELGGEFVDGFRLEAVLAFAAGSVVACRRALDRGGSLPPRLALKLRLDDRRYGWYVDRRAFGPDLYRDGRCAQLVRADGGSITAQEQLEASWAIAREALAETSAADLVAADRIVAEDIPLPFADPLADGFERGIAPEAALAEQPDGTGVLSPMRIESAYERAVQPRRRPCFDLAPVMMTWDVSVFLIVSSDRTRRAFACVPREELTRFMDDLDAGRSDSWIEASLQRPSRLGKLHCTGQTRRTALYGCLGPRQNLLTREMHARARAWRRLVLAWWVERPLRRGRGPQHVSRMRRSHLAEP